MSIGNSLLSPVVQSLASEKSSAHEQGGNMSILQSFGSIGRIIGPIRIKPDVCAVLSAFVFF